MEDFDDLRASGFEGFLSVSALNVSRAPIPHLPGVYLVVRTSTAGPTFLTTGTGGHFKGKDPNVPNDLLASKWVASERVLYIGKAGGRDSAATLNKRITTYLAFGRGKNAGHQGGCYIWQLADAQQLQFCWKATPHEEPATIESQLIAAFKQRTGQWPFANRKD